MKLNQPQMLYTGKTHPQLLQLLSQPPYEANMMSYLNSPQASDYEYQDQQFQQQPLRGQYHQIPQQMPLQQIQNNYDRQYQPNPYQQPSLKKDSSLGTLTTKDKQQQMEQIAQQLAQMAPEDQIQKYMDFIISQHDTNQQKSPSNIPTQRDISPQPEHKGGQEVLINGVPLWKNAPYYYPENQYQKSFVDENSPLKTSTKLILQKGVERRLMTNDIDGAQPRNLSITKGRRHQDFFSDNQEMNQIYNKVGYQRLNDPIAQENQNLHVNDYDPVGKPVQRFHNRNYSNISPQIQQQDNQMAGLHYWNHQANPITGTPQKQHARYDSTLGVSPNVSPHEQQTQFQQIKKEALFNGGAGQIQPLNHAFMDNKRFVRLTPPGTKIGAIINMGHQPQTERSGHVYGQFNKEPVPYWILNNNRQVQFLNRN